MKGEWGSKKKKQENIQKRTETEGLERLETIINTIKNLMKTCNS